MNEQQDHFEQRTQIVVRALLAVVLVGAYIALVIFGYDVPEFFVGLVGVAAGFFLGANPTKRT